MGPVKYFLSLDFGIGNDNFRRFTGIVLHLLKHFLGVEHGPLEGFFPFLVSLFFEFQTADFLFLPLGGFLDGGKGVGGLFQKPVDFADIEARKRTLNCCC